MMSIINIIIFGVCSMSVSYFDIGYMHIKRKKLKSEFEKKFNTKGYKVAKDVDLISLIKQDVVSDSESSARILLSMLPVFNLYPFIIITSKKLDKEYNTILSKLDNQEYFDYLEKNKYIYNKDTISKTKEILGKKIKENHKTNNEFMGFEMSDSLEKMKDKRKLLDEMIYVKEIEEMEKNGSYQESEKRHGKVKRMSFLGKNGYGKKDG